MRIQLPASGWRPRQYQSRLWAALEAGNKRLVEVAHRRWGKDEVALHWAAIAGHLRPATYWHMLPEAAQARKAIWEAINPHTGKRRIDEAFPIELRATTRENEMFIKLKSGSTWQVVGSDNYNSLVGAPPVGVVLSEYALADPRAWAYLRPILEENGGWAVFISTPRGRNHLVKMVEMARSEPGWWCEVSSAKDTGVFSPEQLEAIKREMIAENGPDDGTALFEQEYLVSFDAPLVGAFYARQISDAEKAGRVRVVQYDPMAPVETAWDLGFSDDTAIWWFQVIAGEVRVLDYYASHGQTVEHYCDVIRDRGRERGWSYGIDQTEERHWVPWDAAPKTLASGGKSIVEQAWALGVRMRLVANLSAEDGIQAVRQMLPRCYFDKVRCKDGIEALRNYQREWDGERRVFRRLPLHNWASHGSDAFRYLALAWRERRPTPKPEEPRPLAVGSHNKVTLNDAWDMAAQERLHDRV